MGFCQTLAAPSRDSMSGIRAQTGGGGKAGGDTDELSVRGLPAPLFITATTAVDIRIEAIASAASSNHSGGRVGRSGAMAGEAILVCEFCKRRCSLVALNRDRNCS